MKPGKVVDKVIDMVLDILIPGKGVGQGNWLSRSLRSIENQAERTTRCENHKITFSILCIVCILNSDLIFFHNIHRTNNHL